MRTFIIVSLTICKLLIFIWGFFALWYIAPSVWRTFVLIIWSVLGVFELIRPWYPQRAYYRVAAVVFVLGLLIWWVVMTPLHERHWSPDVSRLLESEVLDDHVVLHNVRNFEWRSETDYTQRWETRSYDLNQLVSADLLLSYWMGPAVAHTLVSFGFADGSQVVFSLEIRKEYDEEFSALAGFFRQYEAVIIAADENDIVRVRTNVRGETVRLYRLVLSKDQLRSAFLGYVQEAEMIRHDPRFYNTLTSNCTTIVYDLARQFAPGLPMDYRLLLSGYFAEYAYDQKGLVAGYDYPSLESKSDISARARAFAGEPDEFSDVIRKGVPLSSSP